jgi:hypothetical protein
MAKPADTTSTPEPTLDDLIAFGRDYLDAIQALDEGRVLEGNRVFLARGILKQYLTRANEGLALLKEQARKKKPRAT